MIQFLSSESSGKQKVTAEEAAEVIYNAVTDESDKLRYFIGKDVGAMIAMRSSMADQEYINTMHKRFSVLQKQFVLFRLPVRSET
ncbi:MAG: hypothetical protein JST09_04940 [Bacteroidetes bacterium]|nr:hypothetical protein [Bacteroidota bacterium]